MNIIGWVPSSVNPDTRIWEQVVYLEGDPGNTSLGGEMRHGSGKEAKKVYVTDGVSPVSSEVQSH